MPFDSFGSFPSRPRIAVVGAGISGLGAAYALSTDNQVTVFEAEPRLGGHARTRMAGRSRQVPVDTGFIVFNYRNYPLLTGLFGELDVPVKKSDMAFAASIDGGAIEYGLHATSALFAQRRNLARPAFWRMLTDIPRFNRGAKALADAECMTLGALLDRLNMGRWFRDYFMLPLSGAVWSATPEEMLDFPAETFIRFFDNHGLLTLHDQPQWYTVDGGSQEYVNRLADALRANGADLRTGAPVEAVSRSEGAWVKAAGGPAEQFDAVIFACHSDQALAMLTDADAEERSVLGDLRYKPNRVILHDDPRVMPARRACWASWNYQGRTGHAAPAVTVSYWMNRLQGIPDDVPLFVTLNPAHDIPDKHIFDEAVLSHPVFDQAAIAAQARLPSIQGRRGAWFCGAYTRYGFHEDGLLSAVNVAKAMGATPQWA